MIVYLVSEISSPAWAAGLALKEWWDGEAESWSIWCVRIIIDMCQKYYWCVSEILLICVRNIIDVSQKYHWCVSEIVLMCVGNIIDVLWKSYWCVFEILLTSTIVCNKRWKKKMDIFWPRNFRLSSQKYIVKMRCILVTYKRTGK